MRRDRTTSRAACRFRGGRRCAFGTRSSMESVAGVAFRGAFSGSFGRAKRRTVADPRARSPRWARSLNPTHPTLRELFLELDFLRHIGEALVENGAGSKAPVLPREEELGRLQIACILHATPRKR